MARLFVQLVNTVHLRFLHNVGMPCQYVQDTDVCVYYLPYWVHTDSDFFSGAPFLCGDWWGGGGVRVVWYGWRGVGWMGGRREGGNGW